MVATTQTALAGLRVLLGVSGSVAAYKAAELARLLVRDGADVRVAMTPAAQRFVTPLTFQAITGKPPVCDMFAGSGSPDGMDHIAQVRAADLFVIAPATASTIARIANGAATEAVSALACAATCPVIVAPAMNREMWANPAVVRNIATLRADGRTVLDAPSGDLACGEHGKGRLSEPTAILEALRRHAQARRDLPLAGKRFVISTGSTVESIDAMRVISNRSSGRMGCAIAAAARDAGAKVILLAGQVSVDLPAGMEAVKRVSDGASMLAAAKQACRRADCFVSVAAIADYRPRKAVSGKLQRKAGSLTLELEPVPDIIAKIAAGSKAPYCVAFAAEAGNMEQAISLARAKLKAKKVDAIVASPLATNLGGDDCDLACMSPRATLRIGPCGKDEAAVKIVSWIAAKLPS